MPPLLLLWPTSGAPMQLTLGGSQDCYLEIRPWMSQSIDKMSVYSAILAGHRSRLSYKGKYYSIQYEALPVSSDIRRLLNVNTYNPERNIGRQMRETAELMDLVSSYNIFDRILLTRMSYEYDREPDECYLDDICYDNWGDIIEYLGGIGSLNRTGFFRELLPNIYVTGIRSHKYSFNICKDKLYVTGIRGPYNSDRYYPRIYWKNIIVDPGLVNSVVQIRGDIKNNIELIRLGFHKFELLYDRFRDFISYSGSLFRFYFHQKQEYFGRNKWLINTTIEGPEYSFSAMIK